MSLEQQVAALVDAANKLTGSVNNKVKEIDDAVKSAVEGVPQAILDNMGPRYIVDQTNGSDSNNGLTASSALKSVREVSRRTPAGAAVEIRLLGDYIFAGGSDIATFQGAQIVFRDWGAPNVRPKITFEWGSVSGQLRTAGFEFYRNCLINIVNVDIHIPYHANMASLEIGRFATLFSTLAAETECNT